MAGPLLTGGREPPAPLTRVIALLTPALLTALVLSSAFATGRDLVVDARAAGVVTGLVLLLLRVPLAVAMVAAALVAAGVRWTGWLG